MASVDLTENEIQKSVFSHIRTRGVPGLVALHPKNASSDMRGRRRGIYTGLGVEPGASDVLLFARRDLPDGSFYCRVFALELKRVGKSVKEGDNQDKFLKRMAEIGATTAWAAGLDDALKQLEAWGLLRGRTA